MVELMCFAENVEPLKFGSHISNPLETKLKPKMYDYVRNEKWVPFNLPSRETNYNVCRVIEQGFVPGVIERVIEVLEWSKKWY